MYSFTEYLEKTKEVGFVDQALRGLVYASGLPNARPNEVVMFEDGSLGQISSLANDKVGILLFSASPIRVGTKVVRTDKEMEINVGEFLLGRAIDPLGQAIDGNKLVSKAGVDMKIDVEPPPLSSREQITKPLETGIAMVDLVIPIAKGQRELVIGDGKTGKTQFLLQAVLSQAMRGTLCIYAAIGKRTFDIKSTVEFFKEKGIDKNTILVASEASDPSGVIFLTPYTATSIAEYFRDQGLDCLLILDGMTTHAKAYREIGLLSRRFPGKNSYPGDVFFIQAKIIERSGNFKKGSITCIPVAETTLGDITGHIETNLMAMTDGHLYFDSDLYSQGRRPAINPFLSVTRVGRKAQTQLQKDISREISSFLVHYDSMKRFMHFGTEIGEQVLKTLNLGERLTLFLNQLASVPIVPVNINLLVLGGIWAGLWKDAKLERVKKDVGQIFTTYITSKEYKSEVDEYLKSFNTLKDLVASLKMDANIITGHQLRD